MKVPTPTPPKQPSENTIALINIVFLMLIFFLIAGSLTPPLDPEVDLIDTTEARSVEPPLALFVTETAELRYQGVVVTPESFIGGLRGADAGLRPVPDKALGTTPEADGPAVRVAADGALPAVRLVEIIDRLKQAGAGKITLVTEREMP